MQIAVATYRSTSKHWPLIQMRYAQNSAIQVAHSITGRPYITPHSTVHLKQIMKVRKISCCSPVVRLSMMLTNDSSYAIIEHLSYRYMQYLSPQLLIRTSVCKSNLSLISAKIASADGYATFLKLVVFNMVKDYKLINFRHASIHSNNTYMKGS